MKSAGNIRISFVSLVIFIFSGIFFFSCGLEEVISIEAPTVTYNNPLYSSDDPLTWYYSFKTAKVSSSDNVSYTGTDVYYKIYNNYSDLVSQKSSILSLNTESNGSAAEKKMTESFSFQQLNKNSSNPSVFCKGHDEEYVVIRLKSYQAGNLELTKNFYSQNACIGYSTSTSNYTYEKNGDDYIIPYRNSSVGTKSFDFFDYNETGSSINVEPADGDLDYFCNSTFSESDCYYVQLFAVARAWNVADVDSVYSLVLDLGSVPIRKGE